MDLQGKAALVTGGASGIGAEAARRLTAAGARVAVADLDEARTRALADEIGGLALPGDAAQPDTMTMAVDIAEDTFGRLDVVLLNAGITAGQSGVENLDLDGYRKIMGVNVDHVVFGLTAALPALRRAGGGTVIATSSLAGLVGMPGDAIYTLSKHAVVGYVRSAAASLAGEPIRVMAVCPGFTDTALIADVRDRFGGLPLLGASDVADALSSMVEKGESGECWFVQPGREPAPFRFRGVPGPAEAGAPPPLHGDG
jgi:NAD(P)-dependent dehydrogenase (short-subunit alcohol dehydrogenase family)